MRKMKHKWMTLAVLLFLVFALLYYYENILQQNEVNDQILVKISSGRYVLMDEKEAQNRASSSASLRIDKPLGEQRLPIVKPSSLFNITNGQHTASEKTQQTPAVTSNATLTMRQSTGITTYSSKVPTNSDNTGICTKYQRVSFLDPICLGNDSRIYFESTSNFTCLLEGSDLVATRVQGGPLCVCKPGWHGAECSMPDVVYRSEDFPRQYGISVAATPRRLIYAMPFNNEFDLLEAKIMALIDIVDLFIIVESNYTAAGKPKDCALLNRLNSGFLSQYHTKQILYVPLYYFPTLAYANGWIIDALLRNQIAEEGLNRIYDLRDDDVIVIQDADELPLPETLMFLKLHHSYTEPIGFHMRHNVFGFYWQGWDVTSNIFGACSVRMLLDVYENKPYKLRNAPNAMNSNPEGVNDYKRLHGGRIHTWSFGSPTFPAGWHCSWCLSPEGIQYKLLSSHQGDFPRWGSITEKTKLPYITGLIRDGRWFDDKITMDKVTPSEQFYAPQYILQHKDIYRNILDANYLNSHG